MNNTPIGFIETMLVQDNSIKLWEYHLQRATASANAISSADFDHQAWMESVHEYIGTSAEDSFILKSTFSKDQQNNIQWSLSARIYTALPTPLSVEIATDCIKHIDQYSWIKSADRTLYDNALTKAQSKGLQDILLLNNKGNVCESCIANVIIEKAGQFYYPAPDQGAVQGVYLDYLLNTRTLPLSSAIISKQDLYSADSVWLCNAVRGLYKIQLITQELPL